MSNIAEKIISKFPSPQIVADICAVDVSTVHKWKYPRTRGGTNGLIPSEYHQVLFDDAPKYGVQLVPEDFFDLPNTVKHKSRSHKAANGKGQAIINSY